MAAATFDVLYVVAYKDTWKGWISTERAFTTHEEAQIEQNLCTMCSEFKNKFEILTMDEFISSQVENALYVETI